MKKKFHKIIGAASLLLLGLASMANAGYLQDDGNGGYYASIVKGWDIINITQENINDGKTTFKVYCGASADAKCKDPSNKVFEVTVPDGYVVQVSGTATIGKNTAFAIGDASLDEYIFDKVNNDEEPLIFNKEFYVAKKPRITVFASDGSSDIDLMVNLTMTIFKEVEDVTLKDGEINMPVMGTNKLTITQEDIDGGLTSFTVYDDGGYYNPYSKNANGFLQIDVPEGYVFKVNVAFAVLEIYESGEVPDGLVVYDGNTTDNVLWQAGVAHAVDGEGAVFVSSKNSMTLNSFSDGNVQHDGFLITVEIIRPTILSVAKVLYNPWSHNKSYAIIDGSYTGTDALDIGEDIEVDTVVFNRTFSTDGYSTLMLPFNYVATNLENVEAIIEFAEMTTNDKGDPAIGMNFVWCSKSVEDALAEEAAKTDDPSKYDRCNTDGTNFPGNITAYTPYMALMGDAELVFKAGATLASTEQKDVSHDGWTFKAALQKKVFTKEETKDGKIWGFAGEERDGAKIGKFVRFGKGAYVQPFRAYLESSSPQLVSASPNAQFAARSAGVETASIESIDVVIVSRGNDGEKHTTTIGKFNTRTGEFQMLRDYDLKGRKTNISNRARGAYYGKKVLKK